MSEEDGAKAVADTLTLIDEIDAEVQALRSARRRGFGIWLAVTVSTMTAALPGGILYALYWGIPYTAAGVVLSLPTRRKLRELEGRQESLLATDEGQRGHRSLPPTHQS